MTTPIERYAYLELQIDRLRASGQPVPVGLANEFQSLRARADAVLSHEQGQAALRHVRAAQAKLLDAERAGLDDLSRTQGLVRRARGEAQSNLAQALRNSGARRISETARLGRDGQQLDERQFNNALKHGKWALPGRVHHVDETVRRASRLLGRDVTADEVGKQMGVFGALMDDSRAMSKYLDEQVGPDDHAARAEMEASIRETWLGYTLRKRHDDELRKQDPDAFKPKVVEMTDDEKRRLDVADALIGHEGPGFFVEQIRDRGRRDADGEALDIRAAMVDAYEAAGDDQDQEVVEALNDRDEVEALAANNGIA